MRMTTKEGEVLLNIVNIADVEMRLTALVVGHYHNCPSLIVTFSGGAHRGFNFDTNEEVQAVFDKLQRKLEGDK